MKTALIVISAISAFALIICVLALPAQTDNFGGHIEGGNDTIFRKKKSGGTKEFFTRCATVCAIVFMASSFLYGLI